MPRLALQVGEVAQRDRQIAPELGDAGVRPDERLEELAGPLVPEIGGLWVAPASALPEVAGPLVAPQGFGPVPGGVMQGAQVVVRPGQLVPELGGGRVVADQRELQLARPLETVQRPVRM